MLVRMDVNEASDQHEGAETEIERLRAEVSRLERERAVETAAARSAAQRVRELEQHIEAHRDRLPAPRVLAARAKRVARRRLGAAARRLGLR